VFLFSAGTDIAGDVLIVLIPFPLLWKLQTTERQKIILIVIFLLPLVPIVFGILRLVFCNPTTGVVDVIKFQMYSLLENSAAIVTACLPSLRLFVTSSRHAGSSKGPGYRIEYSGSAKRWKSRHQDSSIPLSLSGQHSGNAFDDRAFARIDSEDLAASHGRGRPIKGVMVTKEYEVVEGSLRGGSI
jgi:hypothetical protein